jgi:hypothetical protein
VARAPGVHHCVDLGRDRCALANVSHAEHPACQGD